MNHVTHQIQALLSGELPPAECARVNAHLKECPACEREVDEARLLWEALADLEEGRSVVHSNVWPEVRGRTLGRDQAGSWFFGRGRLLQSSLAGAALAAGLFLGILIPGAGTNQVGGEAEALSLSEDQFADLWLEDTSWGEGFTEFASAWIGAGHSEETEVLTEGTEQ